MLWILAILAAYALTKSATKTETGHPPLESVTAYKVGKFTVIVGQDDQGTWDWRAWTTDVLEAADDADGLEEGQGFDHASQAAAKAEAMQWVAAQLEPTPLGMGTPDAPGTVRHGVRMSPDCDSVAVVNIAAWLDYATPIIQAWDVEAPTGDGAMARTLGALFPGCADESTRVRGKSWAQTSSRVQSTIDKIRAGELLSVEEPEEVVAARIVNMSVPRIPGARAIWHTGANNGNKHAIVSLPGAAGQWRYYVWKNARGALDQAFRAGVAGSSGAAIQAGKAEADTYHNVGVG